VIIVFMMIMKAERTRLLHRERMAAIEKGIEIPAGLLSDSAALSPNACLLRGLIWLLTGVALIVTLAGMGVAEGDNELIAGSAIGLVPIGVGIAYLVVYRKLQRAG
jgi:hypothetical protein